MNYNAVIRELERSAKTWEDAATAASSVGDLDRTLAANTRAIILGTLARALRAGLTDDGV